MSRITRLLTVIGTAVVVALSATAPAQAGGVDSKVTFKQSQNRPAKFKGKVTSPDPECVIGRKVQILRKTGGGSEQKVTKTFASESGRYSVTIPMQSGVKLFARIKGGETPGGADCDGDDSQTITG